MDDVALETYDAGDFELDTGQAGCFERRGGGPVDDGDGMFGIEGGTEVVRDEAADRAEAKDVDVHVAVGARGGGRASREGATVAEAGGG